MNDSWYALSFVGVIITVLVLVGALIMVVLRAKGRAKKLGTIGLIIMLVAVVARTFSFPVLASLMTGDLYAPVSQMVGLLLSLLQTTGVALLVAAVIVGSVDATQQRGGPRQPSAQPPSGGQPPMGGRPPYGAEPPVSGGWGPSSSGPRPR